MKLLVTALMLLSLNALAETKGAKERKAEMIGRAQDLRLVAETGEEMFKEEEYASGCESVAELFKGLPNHLTGILGSMDMRDRKVRRMQEEALVMLRDSHALHHRCERGENNEFVDAKSARKQMKEMAKKLKRHANLIEDKSTAFENSYNYSYEF